MLIVSWPLPWDMLCVRTLVLNIERNRRRKSGVTHTVHRHSMKTLEKAIQCGNRTQETDQMCELFHSPARSLTDDEDRRHADMGDSLTDEESQGSECGSCNADCNQGQTMDTRRTDLDMNSFHDTTLPETSEEQAALIRATWEDRPIRLYLNSLDASARNVIVSAARSSKPVVNKVVLDYRYRNHSLVAETNEAVFVYDEARDKVTRWLVNALTLQRDSDWI